MPLGVFFESIFNVIASGNEPHPTTNPVLPQFQKRTVAVVITFDLDDRQLCVFILFQVETLLRQKPAWHAGQRAGHFAQEKHSGAVISPFRHLSQSLSENPGARLCRPRPAAASLEFSAVHRVGRVLRLVCDTAALLFRQALRRFLGLPAWVRLAVGTFLNEA